MVSFLYQKNIQSKHWDFSNICDCTNIDCLHWEISVINARYSGDAIQCDEPRKKTIVVFVITIKCFENTRMMRYGLRAYYCYTKLRSSKLCDMMVRRRQNTPIFPMCCWLPQRYIDTSIDMYMHELTKCVPVVHQILAWNGLKGYSTEKFDMKVFGEMKINENKTKKKIKRNSVENGSTKDKMIFDRNGHL